MKFASTASYQEDMPLFSFLSSLFQIYTRKSNLEFFAKIKKGDAAIAKVYWPSTNLF